MRVLVACDAMAGLGPRAASEVIARAFADEGAQVAVIPLGAGGADLVDALSTMEPSASIVPVAEPEALLAALTPGDATLVLDLTGMAAPDPDELISAFTPEVANRAGAALDGRPLIAVVSEEEAAPVLTGLSGAVAELGRSRGADLAETIAQDGRAEIWARSLGIDPTSVGSGALGGVGAVVQALGGEITSGLRFCLAGYAAREVAAKADVVVTGAAQMDFHAVGGPVVKAMGEVAAEALRPLVVVAGRTYVSSRELRLAGIEAAYPVLPWAGEDQPDAEQLLEAARRVASTWRW